MAIIAFGRLERSRGAAFSLAASPFGDSDSEEQVVGGNWGGKQMFGEGVVRTQRHGQDAGQLAVARFGGLRLELYPQALGAVSAAYRLRSPPGQGGLPTLLSLPGPPNEATALWMFLTMHGCSTTEMARDGIGSHGAVASCCVLLVSRLVALYGAIHERRGPWLAVVDGRGC